MKLPSRISLAGLVCATVLVLPGLLAAQAPIWRPTGPFGGSVSSFAVHPTVPGVLYAAGPGGVFRTRNAGNSWQWLHGPANLSVVAIDPMQPRTLYAASLFYPRTSVFKSTDEGARWTLINRNLPATLNITSLVVDPAQPARIYLTTANRSVWRSGDGGVTWQPASQGLPTGANTFTILAVPRKPVGTTLALDASAAVYAGLSIQETDSGGVLRSANNGASWERRNQGILGLQTLSVAADPTHPDNLVTAVLGLDLFRSANAGMRWVPVRGDIPPIQFAGAVTVTEVVAGGTGTFYFVDPFLDPSRGPQRIWRSSDTGRTWTPLFGPWVRLQTVRVDPLDPETLYVITYNDDGRQLYRSEDGGASWTPLASVLATCGTLDLEVARTSVSAPAILYLGGCRSEDGGATWS